MFNIYSQFKKGSVSQPVGASRQGIPAAAGTIRPVEWRRGAARWCTGDGHVESAADVAAATAAGL